MSSLGGSLSNRILREVLSKFLSTQETMKVGCVFSTMNYLQTTKQQKLKGGSQTLPKSQVLE